MYCSQQLQFWLANDRSAVTFSRRQIKLLKAFVLLLRGNSSKSCDIVRYLKPFCKNPFNSVLGTFMITQRKT